MRMGCDAAGQTHPHSRWKRSQTLRWDKCQRPRGRGSHRVAGTTARRHLRGRGRRPPPLGGAQRDHHPLSTWKRGTRPQKHPKIPQILPIAFPIRVTPSHALNAFPHRSPTPEGIFPARAHPMFPQKLLKTAGKASGEGFARAWCPPGDRGPLTPAPSRGLAALRSQKLLVFYQNVKLWETEAAVEERSSQRFQLVGAGERGGERQRTMELGEKAPTLINVSPEEIKEGQNHPAPHLSPP